MPRPEISFPDHQTELRHGLKILLDAGLTAKQIEDIRERFGAGPGKIPYNKETVGVRRYMVQELLANNLSNAQIARVLQLSKETVNADRHQNRGLWAESILKSQDCHRARIINEAISLKEQALIHFEQSKRKRITAIGDKGETVTVIEGAGESGFLTVAKNCLEQQAKVLGLYDIKPQTEEKKSYKGFLDDLAKTISDVKEKEEKSKSIDVNFKVEDEPKEDDGRKMFGSTKV